jgi:hypothetical protein
MRIYSISHFKLSRTKEYEINKYMDKTKLPLLLYLVSQSTCTISLENKCAANYLTKI